jgi:hypothetical protein
VADGQPAVDLAPSTTDANGRFWITAPKVSAGWHSVDVAFSGDQLLEPASYDFGVRVKHDTIVTMDGPDRLPRKDDVTFVFTLTEVRAGYAGDDLYWNSGASRLWKAETRYHPEPDRDQYTAGQRARPGHPKVLTRNPVKVALGSAPSQQDHKIRRHFQNRRPSPHAAYATPV